MRKAQARSRRGAALSGIALLALAALVATSARPAWAQAPAAAAAPAADTGAGAPDSGIADAPEALVLSGLVGAHDPTIVRSGGTYYRYSSGLGIPMARSRDLRHWEMAGSGKVFDRGPAWTRKDVPGSTDYWAPDVKVVGGRYRIYYSVSTFGSNQSAIGLASNATLDPESPEYAWVDEGPVIESSRADDFNAIDPAVAFDAAGDPWLAFGSFWSGIKIARLNRDSGKLARPGEAPLSIARRPEPPDAIEGAYILPKDGAFYLFVSFDYCCRGSRSTYNIRVGRSTAITGPYLDRGGKPMLEGGGSLVRESGDRYKGPGHSSVLQADGQCYLVYHAYDAQASGRVRCRIEPLKWDSELWPYVTGIGSSEGLAQPSSATSASSRTESGEPKVASGVP